MHKDERDLLEVLKFELNFLEKGGYGRSPREAWRPQFIFEDSPTCMNYDSKEDPEPCSHCVLMQLVPPAFRSATTPCRHIPMNQAGESLDSLYRYDDQAEIEESVEKWLRMTINKLEEGRKKVQPDSGRQVAVPDSSDIPGTPLFHKFHPKCANPACPTAFHWLSGGKFFRFRPNEVGEVTERGAGDASGNLHGVRHFWLCERCSHVFTLRYDREHGVVLHLLWAELPLAEARAQLTAAPHL
jgi:hypothetical protein